MFANEHIVEIIKYTGIAGLSVLVIYGIIRRISSKLTKKQFFNITVIGIVCVLAITLASIYSSDFQQQATVSNENDSPVSSDKFLDVTYEVYKIDDIENKKRTFELKPSHDSIKLNFNAPTFELSLDFYVESSMVSGELKNRLINHFEIDKCIKTYAESLPSVAWHLMINYTNTIYGKDENKTLSELDVKSGDDIGLEFHIKTTAFKFNDDYYSTPNSVAAYAKELDNSSEAQFNWGKFATILDGGAIKMSMSSANALDIWSSSTMETAASFYTIESGSYYTASRPIDRDFFYDQFTESEIQKEVIASEFNEFIQQIESTEIIKAVKL